MNCNEARQHWNLYHDSEGDADLHFRINEHLGLCPSCTEWFSQQSRLEGMLVDKMRQPRPTPELWNRALTQAGLKKRSPVRQWLWMGIAASVIISCAILWLIVRPVFSNTPDLAKLSAEWHERLEAGIETPQFRSQSDLDVEAYLRERVVFPVRCPPRKDAGFMVEGAGVFRLADQPAAYLSGNVDNMPVSIFVLPSGSLNAFPSERDAVKLNSPHRSTEGQYQVVMSIIDRNAVLVVSKADPDRLQRILVAYGAYPDHP